eukprot:1802783-Amphidinium_carterae.2
MDDHRYGDLIQKYSTRSGPEHWSIIYSSDVRMRSEHFERWRRSYFSGDTSNRGSPSLPPLISHGTTSSQQQWQMHH